MALFMLNEACDDGNESETDACLSDCSAASCGMDLSTKGSSNVTTATPIHRWVYRELPRGACGDGFVWADEGACDDGNRDDTDDCRIPVRTKVI